MSGWGWDRLRAVGRPVVFRRGDRLIVAGTASDDVWLLESGLVKVALADLDGMELILAFLGGGNLVGELSALGSGIRSAHVVALRSGRAVRVSGRHFARMRTTHPEVLELVDRTWRKRQQVTDDRHRDSARDVTSRLAISLLRWARDFGEPTEHGLLTRGISQRDIAQAITVSDKSVEAALRTLRAAELVKTRRLSYLIFQPARLETAILQANWRSGRSP